MACLFWTLWLDVTSWSSPSLGMREEEGDVEEEEGEEVWLDEWEANKALCQKEGVEHVAFCC